MDLVNTYVSVTTKANFEIFMRSSARNPDSWQTNMCFEVTVTSPYANADDYSTWEAGSTPGCTPTTNGLELDCKLQDGSTQVLQFYFTSLAAEIEQFNSLRFSIDGFRTPFSNHELEIKMKVYQDAACTQADRNNRRDITIKSATIYPRIIAADSVSFESSSKVIAY